MINKEQPHLEYKIILKKYKVGMMIKIMTIYLETKKKKILNEKINNLKFRVIIILIIF